MSNGRSIGLIAGSLVGLIVLAVVIVQLAERRQPRQFAAGSPEATVQVYLQAWDDGDLETAYSQFTDAARRGMSLDEYKAAARNWQASRGGEIRDAVFIDRSTIAGSFATVYLIVETTYGSDLEQNTYRSERELTLERGGGAWRITDALVFVDLARDYHVTY